MKPNDKSIIDFKINRVKQSQHQLNSYNALTNIKQAPPIVQSQTIIYNSRQNDKSKIKQLQDNHQELDNILQANEFMKQIKQKNQVEAGLQMHQQIYEQLNSTQQKLISGKNDDQQRQQAINSQIMNGEKSLTQHDLTNTQLNTIQNQNLNTEQQQQDFVDLYQSRKRFRCPKFSFPLYGKLAVSWKVFLMTHIIYLGFVIPFRISFDADPDLKDVIIDMYITMVFICDMLITFLTPIPDEEGKLIYDKKRIANAYIRKWFFFDLIVCFPLTYYRHKSSNKYGNDDWKNLVTLNFGQISRVYKILLLSQLIRLRKGMKIMRDIMKRLNLKIELANILQNFCTLFFMIHLLGCLFTTSATFDLGNYMNWITNSNQQNEDNFMIYLSAMYFAIVTCATVGYGDILPKNKFEIMLTNLIVIFGVSYFSYVLSDLSNQFSELQRENKIKEDREKILNAMEKVYKVDEKVLTKIKFFFKEHESNLDLSNNLEMSYLLRILPTNLKTQLAIFLYKDAINAIKFLQNRKNTFYEQYLDKLKPMRFDRDTVILEQGNRSNEVCLIMSGQVLNQTTGRIMPTGTLFGEGDIIFKRERKDTYIAESEVYIFKYERKIFEIMLKQYPEIEEEVRTLAMEREKIRNNQDAIKTMIQEDSVKDVIMKYFEQIKEAEIIYAARMNQNNSTKLKSKQKQVNSEQKETTETKQIESEVLKKLDSNATTKEVYEILQGSILKVMRKNKEEKKKQVSIESDDSQDEIQNALFSSKNQQIASKNTVKSNQSSPPHITLLNSNYKRGSPSRYQQSNHNTNQRQDSIINSNKSTPSMIKYQKLPGTSHENRIMNIRLDIKSQMQIFEETKLLIDGHLKSMKETEKQENLPLGIKETYKEGIKGLEKYKSMMDLMQSQLKKNRKVTNKMFHYQKELRNIDLEMNDSEQKAIKSLNLMETKFQIQSKIVRSRNSFKQNQNLDKTSDSQEFKPFRINRELLNAPQIQQRYDSHFTGSYMNSNVLNSRQDFQGLISPAQKSIQTLLNPIQTFQDNDDLIKNQGGEKQMHFNFMESITQPNQGYYLKDSARLGTELNRQIPNNPHQETGSQDNSFNLGFTMLSPPSMGSKQLQSNLQISKSNQKPIDGEVSLNNSRYGIQGNQNIIFGGQNFNNQNLGQPYSNLEQNQMSINQNKSPQFQYQGYQPESFGRMYEQQQKSNQNLQTVSNFQDEQIALPFRKDSDDYYNPVNQQKNDSEQNFKSRKQSEHSIFKPSLNSQTVINNIIDGHTNKQSSLYISNTEITPVQMSKYGINSPQSLKRQSFSNHNYVFAKESQVMSNSDHSKSRYKQSNNQSQIKSPRQDLQQNYQINVQNTDKEHYLGGNGHHRNMSHANQEHSQPVFANDMQKPDLRIQNSQQFALPSNSRPHYQQSIAESNRSSSQVITENSSYHFSKLNQMKQRLQNLKKIIEN
eukprot:403360386